MATVAQTPGVAALTAPRRRALRSRAALWVPALAYLLLSVWLYRDLVRHPGSRVAAASGVAGADHTLYAWFFEWARYCVTHGTNPLFTTKLAAPAGVNLAWNTPMLPLAFLALPVTVVFGAYRAVSFALVLSPVVDAWTAYLVARRVLGRRYEGPGGRIVGPLVVGAVYGFNPFDVGHSGHLNLIFNPFLPLLVLFADAVLRRPDGPPARAGLALGVLLSAQFLVSEELTVLSLLGFTVAGLVALACFRRRAAQRIPAILRCVGVVAVTAAVLVGWLVAFQLFGPGRIAHGVHVWDFRPDLSYLWQPNWWEQFSHPSGDFAPELTLFLGWPVLLGSVAAGTWLLVRHRDRFARWWLPTTAVFVVLSAGPELRLHGSDLVPGPWRALSELPLLSGAIPSRTSLLTDSMVAALAGYLIARASARLVLPVTAAVLACLVPMTPVLRYPTLPAPAPSTFFSAGARTLPADATVLIVPLVNSPQLAGMRWQIDAHLRFRIIGGYGVFPLPNGKSTYHAPFPAGALAIQAGTVPPPGQHPAAAASLRSAGVQDIVIADGPPAAAQTAVAVAITGCRAEHVDDVTLCRLSGG